MNTRHTQHSAPVELALAAASIRQAISDHKELNASRSVDHAFLDGLREGIAIVHAYEDALSELQQLRKQRDELAGALREVKAVANDYTVALPVPAMRMYEVARAALASLEGGQG